MSDITNGSKGTNNKQSTRIAIEKAYTFFMMPFYINTHQEMIPSDSSGWKRDNIYEPFFDDIYFGSTVEEGGGVLTIQNGNGDVFMKDFATGPLTKSYLWVYLLVMMQRHTLLKMSRRLAEEYGYSETSLDERLHNLRSIMREMSRTKINTFVTDVSDHSLLNGIYRMCCRNLSIERYFADVDNKLYTLKETLEQFHDEQMERYEREQKAIKEEHLEVKKREEAHKQNIGKWGAVIAMVLTIFSALNDSYDLLGSDKMGLIPDTVSPFCRFAFIFGIIMVIGLVIFAIVESFQETWKFGHNKI